MRFTQEQIMKARMARNPEELSIVIRDAGIDMSMEQVHKSYAMLHDNGEMSDNELMNVAGGRNACDIIGDTPFPNY